MEFLSILLLLVYSWIPNRVNCILAPPTRFFIPCQVSIKNIPSPQPLFLQPGTNNMWPVSEEGTMDLTYNQKIELYCPSDYSHPTGLRGAQIASCASGTMFNIGNALVDLEKVNCTRWVSPIAEKTNIPCEGGKIVETGFQIQRRFVKHLKICFNENQEVTRYVHYTLNPGSDEYQSNVQRPEFKHDSRKFFPGKKVNDLYSGPNTEKVFQEALGGAYKNYTDRYLARGHLAAMVDFVYGTQQRGTFLFVNAAPQWQSINNGNWRKIEDGVRNFVSRKKKYVDCYTGVHGVTTLRDNNGTAKPLYLDYNNTMIPVPQLFFRVVIEQSSQRGIAFVTVNNPYQNIQNVCTDVSNQLSWIKAWVKWEKNDSKSGISYACDVTDFIKKVKPYLPKLNVKGLLS